MGFFCGSAACRREAPTCPHCLLASCTALNFWVGGQRDVRADRILDVERNASWPSKQVVAKAAHASAAVALRDDGGGGSVAAADDALLEEGEDAGLLAMLAFRHVENELGNSLFPDRQQVAKFLQALAVGADAQWPADTAASHHASQVRAHLILLLGAPKAAAVLRGLVRDGRLYPGLAPKLGDGVVGTEKHAFSSREQIRAWVRKEGDQEVRKKALL